MMNEIYRLTLEHFICHDKDKHQLDEPLVVQMVIDKQYAPTAICLNRMLDRMREELLRIGGEG